MAFGVEISNSAQASQANVEFFHEGSFKSLSAIRFLLIGGWIGLFAANLFSSS
jgi:hypothetical protein